MNKTMLKLFYLFEDLTDQESSELVSEEEDEFWTKIPFSGTVIATCLIPNTSTEIFMIYFSFIEFEFNKIKTKSNN